MAVKCWSVGSPTLWLPCVDKSDSSRLCGIHLLPVAVNVNGRHSKSRLRCSLNIGTGAENIAAIAANKVVVAATLSVFIAQLSKPFTRGLIYGKDFNPTAALQAGGFPSSHSSAVVATAAVLALERGFADSVVGMSAVYATLVMYDAQGVRREVGNHATALNKVLRDSQCLCKPTQESGDSSDSLTATSSSSTVKVDSLLKEHRLLSTCSRTTLTDVDRTTDQRIISSSSLDTIVEKRGELSYESSKLKESIGHTTTEVVAGALLGLLVGVAVHFTL